MLLKNARIVDWLPFGLTTGDLLIEQGQIARRGASISPSGAEVIDLEGRLVMPGWVVGHHHLYSALARGMPAPPRAPKNFTQVLQLVWWVLDRCLEEGSIRYSALAGGLDALLCGSTFVVDHHASPLAITGSLGTIAEALHSLGVRSCLAYEVSDRDGPDICQEGIEENATFEGIEDWSWPFAGGHASFTMHDDTLAVFGAGGRIHVHLLEDPADRLVSVERYGASPVERFDRAGLLGPGSLFAHGVHLTDEEFDLLVERKAWLAYNPRSNANNAVGTRSLDRYVPIGCLGTDGMDADLWTEMKFAYFTACAAKGADPMGSLVTMLQNNYRLASQLSGLSYGSLAEGAPADLVVLDYQSPTELTDQNFLGHLVYGMGKQCVQSVMVDGQWRIKDRLFTQVDAAAILAEARGAACDLWGRMKELWAKEGGHPYLA